MLRQNISKQTVAFRFSFLAISAHDAKAMTSRNKLKTMLLLGEYQLQLPLPVIVHFWPGTNENNGINPIEDWQAINLLNVLGSLI